MAAGRADRRGGYGATFRRYSTFAAAAVCVLEFFFVVTFVPLPAGGIPSGWGVPQLLEHDDTGNATNPRIAMNDDGFGISAWEQSNGTRTSIWGARMAPGSPWQSAVLLESNDSGDAYAPDVGIDGEGNAFVIWAQSNGSQTNVWANRCDVAGAWVGPELLEIGDVGDYADPALAVDSFGNAVAVWAQDDGIRLNIWSNRFDSASQRWGVAVLIETDDRAYARYPDVSIGGDGSAFAVWYEWSSDIWANRWDPVTRLWGTAANIEAYAGYAWPCKVGVDATGDALAVWLQTYDGDPIVFARRYDAALRQWGSVVSLSSPGQGWAYAPDLAVDRNGNGFAVWYQWDDHSTGIWAKQFRPSIGWGRNFLLETRNVPAYYPNIVMNPRGDALAVWQQKDGAYYGIWANRYSAATDAWQGAELIETDDRGDATKARVAIDAGGNGTAVWQQDAGGVWSAWANSFSRGFSPTLEADGAPGFESDGLDPEIGVAGISTFTYRVRYSDPDNDSPLTGTPAVHILKGGIPLLGSPFSMSEVDPRDTDFTDGKTYSYSTQLAIPGNDYSYCFSAQDRVNQSAADWPAPAAAGPTVVPPTATVVGTVRSDGSGVSGASISLRDGATVVDQNWSDSLGNFTFTKVQPGTYSVEASKPGFYPDTVNVTVAPGDVASVSLSLSPIPGTLEVTVMMDLNPAAGATVDVTQGGTAIAQGVTDEFGLATFSTLVPGTYIVQATWACRASEEETVNITSDELETVTLVLDAATLSRTVELRIRSDSGPLPGATVSLLNGGGIMQYTLTTDAIGRVRFLNVTPGTYRVLVSASGFIGATAQVSVGECDENRNLGAIVLARELVPVWSVLLLIGVIVITILLVSGLIVLRRRRQLSRP